VHRKKVAGKRKFYKELFYSTPAHQANDRKMEGRKMKAVNGFLK